MSTNSASLQSVSDGVARASPSDNARATAHTSYPPNLLIFQTVRSFGVGFKIIIPSPSANSAECRPLKSIPSERPFDVEQNVIPHPMSVARSTYSIRTSLRRRIKYYSSLRARTPMRVFLIPHPSIRLSDSLSLFHSIPSTVQSTSDQIIIPSPRAHSSLFSKPIDAMRCIRYRIKIILSSPSANSEECRPLQASYRPSYSNRSMRCIRCRIKY